MNIIRCMLHIDKDNHWFIRKKLTIIYYNYYIVLSYGQFRFYLWYDDAYNIKISIRNNGDALKYFKYNDQCPDVLDKLYKIFEEFYK